MEFRKIKFKNGNFGKLIWEWNFGKFKNWSFEKLFENWSENKIIWKSGILKIILKNNLWKRVSIKIKKEYGLVCSKNGPPKVCGVVFLNNNHFSLAISMCQLFNFIHHLHPRKHLVKHNMFAIQPMSCYYCNEELRSIRVRPNICHWHKSWTNVIQFKVLISKPLTIDWLSTSSITMGKITSLDHKVGNNPMECTPFVMKRFPTLSPPFLYWPGYSSSFCLLENRSTPQLDHQVEKYEFQETSSNLPSLQKTLLVLHYRTKQKIRTWYEFTMTGASVGILEEKIGSKLG